MKIEIEEAPEGVVPRCPYCKNEIRKVWMLTRGWGILGSPEKQFIMCPSCEALLGYGSYHL